MTTKSISIQADTFVKMLEFLETSFGSAGNSMMFQMGRVAGLTEARKVLNEAPLGDHSPRELMDRVMHHVSGMGIAEVRLNVFDLERGEVKVTYHGNAFEPLCLSIDLPQCFWMRGFLTGMISEVTGVTLTFKESECYAFGDADCSIRMTRD
jgi:predicted hydrocarbon binding protein